MILAGDRYPEAALGTCTNKALLPVGDRLCLAHVLTAVQQSSAARSVIIVGPPVLDDAIASVEVTKPVRRVDQGESLIDNIQRAFDTASEPPDERIIMVAADTPLVTAAELDRFANLAAGSSADAVIAMARTPLAALSSEMADAYRESMIVAAGGPYLPGNFVALRPAVLGAAKIIERARRLRKQSSVVNMVRTLPTLIAMGVRAVPALIIWLRLVTARSIWRRRRRQDRIPFIAPSLVKVGRSITALVARKASVEFVDIGAEGACFDIDNERQYETVRTVALRWRSV